VNAATGSMAEAIRPASSSRRMGYLHEGMDEKNQHSRARQM
jgi:hypothetical protein